MALPCQRGGQTLATAGVTHNGTPKTSFKALTNAAELVKSFPSPVVTDRIHGSKRICGFIIRYSKYLLMVIRQKE